MIVGKTGWRMEDARAAGSERPHENIRKAANKLPQSYRHVVASAPLILGKSYRYLVYNKSLNSGILSIIKNKYYGKAII